jgi:hypothetical protein
VKYKNGSEPQHPITNEIEQRLMKGTAFFSGARKTKMNETTTTMPNDKTNKPPCKVAYQIGKEIAHPSPHHFMGLPTNDHLTQKGITTRLGTQL